MRALTAFLIPFLVFTLAEANCRVLFSNHLRTRVHLGEKVEYQLETNPLQKRECLELIKRSLLSDRYGLKNWNLLSEDQIDRGHHIYISARSESGKLLSVTRLIPNTDLSIFKNIDHSQISQGPYRPNELATIGFYSAYPNSKQHIHLFKEGIRQAFHHALKIGIQGFYSETTLPTFRYASTFGTKLLTDWFTPHGWKIKYRGGLWEFEETRKAITDDVFRQEWEQQYGINLNLKLLRFMYEGVELNVPR